MRVAVVHTYSARAGREGHEAELVHRDRALADLLGRRTGWEVHGFGCTEGSQPVVQGGSDDLPAWTWLPIDPGQEHLLRGLRRSAELVAEVAGTRPDVLLVKGIGTPMADELIGQLPSATVAAVVGGRYRYPAAVRAQLALTEDDEQDRYFRRRLGRGGFLRLPKLVEPRFFQPAAAPAYDVVCIGSFHPLKNQQALLPLREHPLRLAFVGDGPERPRLEEAFEGGRADVRFLGDVAKQEVADALARSRLLVHPSRSEGFPRAVAEAMAAGVPVVAVRGVVSAPVASGRNGVLVREDRLVAEVLALLADQRRRGALGAEARATAERAFSLSALEQAVNRLVPLLEAARRPVPTSQRLLRDAERRVRALHDAPAAVRVQVRRARAAAGG